MRDASSARPSRFAEERELDIALAKAAVSAPFSVAGSQRLREPLQLFLRGKEAAASGQGSSAICDAKCLDIGADGIQEDALQAVLQAAEPAPFGRNSESVLDPTYRNALQIKAGSFGLSAVLPTPQMLHDISTLMQPAAPQIFAQLHKVNVYGPGGMFKAHADTPTCAAQFGSLVVALPYEFEGGELVVTHAGQSATLTLGGGGNSGDSTGGSSSGGGPLLHFAAFFSDCIHEVLPVRSGHRVTLTFNLLLAEGEAEGEAVAEVQVAGKRRRQEEEQADEQQQKPPPPLLSAVRPLAGGSIPFVAKLRELLAQPTWHPEGCTLGYVMQHQYATSLRDLDTSMFPRALKGGDRLLHAALCGELGLEGTVRPLHFAREKEDEQETYEDGAEPLDFMFVGRDFQEDSSEFQWYYLEVDSRHSRRSREYAEMESSRFTKAQDAAAVWIGLRERARELFTLRSSAIAYGNQPVSTTIYSGVVLLLQVPAWGTPGRARAMAA